VNIAIIGCGCLGGVIAARLLQAEKHKVSIIDPNEEIQRTISDRGLVLKTWRKRRGFMTEVFDNSTLMPEKVDLAIVGTKANNTIEAAKAFLPLMKANAVFITVQNGLVGLDLANEVGAEKVIQGVVLWGASMKGPGEYKLTARGPFIIGSLSEKPLKSLDQVQSVLGSVFPVYVSFNIEGVLWAKMHITCALTSLGAITGLRFGRMLQHRKTRTLALGIGKEVLAVARARNVKLEPLGNRLDIEYFLDENGARLWRKHYTMRFIGFHHRKTESSMLADIRAGKKTEIDHLNGLIQKYSEEKGIDIPLNTKVIELVKKLESNVLQPSPDNIFCF